MLLHGSGLMRFDKSLPPYSVRSARCGDAGFVSHHSGYSRSRRGGSADFDDRPALKLILMVAGFFYRRSLPLPAPFRRSLLPAGFFNTI